MAATKDAFIGGERGATGAAAAISAAGRARGLKKRVGFPAFVEVRAIQVVEVIPPPILPLAPRTFARAAGAVGKPFAPLPDVRARAAPQALRTPQAH